TGPGRDPHTMPATGRGARDPHRLGSRRGGSSRNEGRGLSGGSHPAALLLICPTSRRREDFRHRCQLRFRRAPSRMSAFNADALMASPSWKSMARTALLSRRVLKSPCVSFSWAPVGDVSLTAL